MKTLVKFHLIIISIIICVLPFYAHSQTYALKITKFILFDINKDGREELITEKEGCIFAYQIIDNQLVKLGNSNSIRNVQNFIEAGEELYVLADKVLYICSFTNSKLSFIKVKDLSLMIDYTYQIFLDQKKMLNIIGEKVLGKKSLKKEVVLIKLSNNKLTKYQLKTFNYIHDMCVLIDNDVNVILINGVEERIDGLTIYRIKNNKLVVAKNINLPKNTFTSATFFPIGKSLYVSGWTGNVETNQSFVGIFKVNLVNGKIDNILKLKSQPYWLDIGDVDADGEPDIVWTDNKGLNVELFGKPIN